MNQQEEVIITADIHLVADDNHPINQSFYSFLNTKATQAKSLYLIGDIFEAWVGDDINLAQYQTVINIFKKLTNQGLKIYLMYGNRDFLMGHKFWQATGIIKLPEPTIININNLNIILVHGDHLCTGDTKYQKMRSLFRKKIVQWLFLKLPKTTRINIGYKMRNKSTNDSSQKPITIMDVNQQAVINLFNKYPNSDNLIHGHTHKPNQHQFMLNNQPKNRWVLGDWRPAVEYISIHNNKIEFKNFA